MCWEDLDFTQSYHLNEPLRQVHFTFEGLKAWSEILSLLLPEETVNRMTSLVCYNLFMPSHKIKAMFELNLKLCHTSEDVLHSTPHTHTYTHTEANQMKGKVLLTKF